MSSIALGYTRVSTTDQELSLVSQDKAIVAYCEFKGLQLLNLYTDRGTSGAHPLGQRPRGAALLRSLQPGNHVVIHKLDRAWRNARDCLATVEAWDKQQVTLHIVDMGMDLSTPIGRCFLTIAAAFAEMERAFISQRTKEGLAQSTKRLGNTPYGETPAEGAAVQFALWCRRQGYSWSRTARALDRSGHPARSGRPWHPEALRRICTKWGN